MFDFKAHTNQYLLSNRAPLRNSTNFNISINNTPFAECIDTVNMAVLKMQSLQYRHMVNLTIEAVIKNEMHVYEVDQCFTGTALCKFIGEENVNKVLHEIDRIFARKMNDVHITIEIDVTKYGVSCNLFTTSMT